MNTTPDKDTKMNTTPDEISVPIPSLAELEQHRVESAAREGRTLLEEGSPETQAIFEHLELKAREQTLDTLPAFLTKLTQEYQHDYGTICKAMALAAVAAASAVNASPQGHITGFQAGAVMWEFIRAWKGIKGTAMRLVDYGDMLYPQHESDFDKTMSSRVFATLQKTAEEKLATVDYAHPSVRQHWQSIVDGNVPFGYTLKDD